jgi:hypothetical protein
LLPQNSKKRPVPYIPHWPRYVEIHLQHPPYVEVQLRCKVYEKVVVMSRRYVTNDQLSSAFFRDEMLRHLDKLAREEYNSTYEPVLYKLPPDTQF